MLSIQPATPEDLPQTAALHRAHLRLGLFPRMGSHFLQHYQETFALSPHGIALVAREDDGGILGALFGTSSNGDHYRWVMRNCGLHLAFAGSTALLLRPQVAWTFASTRAGRYVRGLRRHLGSSPPQSGPSEPVSVLSHIVTHESARRRGIGRQLVDEFRALARAEGAQHAVLVTEEGGLGAPFFERIGCVFTASRLGQDGCVVREYRLPLEEEHTHEIVGDQRFGRGADWIGGRRDGAERGQPASDRRNFH